MLTVTKPLQEWRRLSERPPGAGLPWLTVSVPVTPRPLQELRTSPVNAHLVLANTHERVIARLRKEVDERSGHDGGWWWWW